MTVEESRTDPLYDECKLYALRLGVISIEALARNFKIDSIRAGRLLEALKGDVIDQVSPNGLDYLVVKGHREAWKTATFEWAFSLTEGQPHWRAYWRFLRRYPLTLVPAAVQAAVIAYSVFVLVAWIECKGSFASCSGDPMRTELVAQALGVSTGAGAMAWFLAKAFLAVNVLWLAMGELYFLRTAPDRLRPTWRTTLAPFAMAWLPLRFIGEWLAPEGLARVLNNAWDWRSAKAVSGRVLQVWLLSWALTGESIKSQGQRFEERLEEEGNALVDALASYVMLPIYWLCGVVAVWTLVLPWLGIYVSVGPTSPWFVVPVAYLMAMNKAALVAYLLDYPAGKDLDA